MPSLRTVALALAALVLAAAVAAFLYEMKTRPVHERQAPPPALGNLALDSAPRPVPSVGFTQANGTRDTLASFHGHYVLLNVWATWCAPCVRELPALAALKARLPRLTIVAVNVGREDAAHTAEFLNGHGAAGLSVYLDSDVALIRAFDMQGLPFSVIIDPSGHEIARATGPCAWAAPAAIGYLRAMISPASGAPR